MNATKMWKAARQPARHVRTAVSFSSMPRASCPSAPCRPPGTGQKRREQSVDCTALATTVTVAKPHGRGIGQKVGPGAGSKTKGEGMGSRAERGSGETGQGRSVRPAPDHWVQQMISAENAMDAAERNGDKGAGHGSAARGDGDGLPPANALLPVGVECCSAEYPVSKASITC